MLSEGAWEDLLDVACPHVLFAREDFACAHPLYLGNTFWHRPPIMPQLRGYDVVRYYCCAVRAPCRTVFVCNAQELVFCTLARKTPSVPLGELVLGPVRIERRSRAEARIPQVVVDHSVIHRQAWKQQSSCGRCMLRERDTSVSLLCRGYRRASS